MHVTNIDAVEPPSWMHTEVRWTGPKFLDGIDGLYAKCRPAVSNRQTRSACGCSQMV